MLNTDNYSYLLAAGALTLSSVSLFLICNKMKKGTTGSEDTFIKVDEEKPEPRISTKKGIRSLLFEVDDSFDKTSVWDLKF